MQGFSSEIPASGASKIGRLDEELYRLARGAGRLRLRIGQALHRLGDEVHELGFSTLGAYALERCCRGGRWAAESRTLARRLQSLPQLENAFVSEAHYARERLGMSRAALRSKVSLARRSRGLDYVVDALQQGRIGFEAAQLVARIATADTERAWVERATGRTFKHLREEVQAVELAARFVGQTDRSPPSEDQIAQVQALERAILSGELLRKLIRNLAFEPHEPTKREEAPTVQISGSPQDEGPNEAPDQAVQISGGPGGKVTLRMRVPGDLLLWYRQLERIHRQKLPGTSFIQFLCASFWQTWVPTLGISDNGKRSIGAIATVAPARYAISAT